MFNRAVVMIVEEYPCVGFISVRSSADAYKKKRDHPFECINGWEGGVKNLTGAKTSPLILSLKLLIIAIDHECLFLCVNMV
jgi:hypothetical protein